MSDLEGVKLAPCPLCNVELFHNGGTELGDIYEHPANGCAIQVAWFTATPEWVAKWNRRAIPSTVSGETAGWGAEAEWELEQRAFHAANREDVPEDVRKTVADLWKQYCIAALANHEARGDGVRGTDEYAAYAAGQVIASFNPDAYSMLEVTAPNTGGYPFTFTIHTCNEESDRWTDLSIGVTRKIADQLAELLAPLPPLGDGRAEIVEECAKVADEAAKGIRAAANLTPTEAARLTAQSIASLIRELSLEQGEKP